MDIKTFFETMWKLIQDFVGPLGGLAVAIAGTANFLAGKIAERKLEELKNKHSKEVELYKTQLEIAKSSLARYSEQQFGAYNELWYSLHQLKSAGDQLWELAGNQNLYQFASQLKITKEMVAKNSLFIEDDHYEQLQNLLNTFSEYQFGKKRLIELRKQDRFDSLEIDARISHNHHVLEQYTQLIADIRNRFRQQINVKVGG